MYPVCIRTDIHTGVNLKFIIMIGATTSIVHDTRIQKNDGTYAIKLRITYNREQKYFPLGKFLSKENWETYKSSKHRNKNLKELEIYLSTIENKAVKLYYKRDKTVHFTNAQKYKSTILIY